MVALLSGFLWRKFEEVQLKWTIERCRSALTGNIATNTSPTAGGSSSGSGGSSSGVAGSNRSKQQAVAAAAMSMTMFQPLHVSPLPVK